MILFTNYYTIRNIEENTVWRILRISKWIQRYVRKEMGKTGGRERERERERENKRESVERGRVSREGGGGRDEREGTASGWDEGWRMCIVPSLISLLFFCRSLG